MLLSRTPSVRAGAVAAALAVALTGALAGCGSDNDKSSGTKDSTSSASDTPAACKGVKSGSESDAVKVSGDFGKKQTATFKAPFKATELERTVVTKGSGATPKSGDTLVILLDVYSGKSGKSLGSQQTEFPVGSDQIPDAFRAGVDCVPIGSRSVVTTTAKAVYGDQGNPRVGVSPDDSLVIVTDVISKKAKPKPPTLPKPAAWTNRVPNITFDKSGKPTLKLPAGKPESKLELKVLKPGTGPVVGNGDQVTVDYQGTSWDTGKVFDESYGKQPATFGTDQVVPGFGAALVGQKVGTRLVVTIPPQYAYGPKGSGQQLAGETLVFVIEIKSTKAA